MATLPTQTKSFPPGNRWGIGNGHCALIFTMRALVHAGVTAGHSQGWRQSVLSVIGGRAELVMRAAALFSTVYETNTPRGSSQAPIARLFPTDRFNKMDDSEKRGLTYHLGITMSVAWARQVLGIPWLLHLNVYEQQLNINLQPGRSRPDLVGLHPDGSWVVFESKGRSSAPSVQAEGKAKTQSQRVTDIGGIPPVSCFALFAYFYRDPSAIGKKKPSVVHLRINDPEPGGQGEPIELPALTHERLFQWYYQPWLQLLRQLQPVAGSDEAKAPPVNSTPTPRPSPLIWYELPDLDIRIGILAELLGALQQERYRAVPGVIQQVTLREGLTEQYPDWGGDGLIIEPGESWKKLWHEE